MPWGAKVIVGPMNHPDKDESHCPRLSRVLRFLCSLAALRCGMGVPAQKGSGGTLCSLAATSPEINGRGTLATAFVFRPRVAIARELFAITHARAKMFKR